MLNSLAAGAVAMNLLALGLVIARAPVFRTRLYRPMLLNLVLAVVPLVVLMVVTVVAGVMAVAGAPLWLVVAVLVAGFAVWMLLLPNAGYLITELNLSHRRPGEQVPEWYDVLLVLSLAMTGVLNTVLNVFLVQFAWVLLRHGDTAEPLAGTEARALAVVVLLLVSFGIYLGRNLRLNSWDVVRPWRVVRAVVDHLRSPGALRSAVAFTLLATVFFVAMYAVVIGPVVQGLIAIEAGRG